MAGQPLPTWRPAPASLWHQLRRNPAVFLASLLYNKILLISTPPVASPRVPSSEQLITVVCISDTHNTQPDVPDGDVLLHAGDLTKGGSFEELQDQLSWLQALPHRYKVVIAGNHDLLLDPGFVAKFPDRIYEEPGTSRSDLNWGDIIYLNNTSKRLDFLGRRSLNIFGSPLTVQCGTWAFQYPPIRSVWAGTVPDETDILLTHQPPKGHLDQQGKGCPQLLKEIWRVRPRLVVFGHIHEGHGRQNISYDALQAAYDGVITKDRGFLVVFWMALLVLCQLLLKALPLTQTQPRSQTVLVNAAVIAGRPGQERTQAPIVVEI